MAAEPLIWRAGGREGRPRPKDDWRTPPDLHERLDREFHFKVDAACTPENSLCAVGMYAGVVDALAQPWPTDLGSIWLNPPYSNVRPWLVRAQEAGLRVPVVCLLPADTSTRWWWDLVATSASEVRFLRGRVRFYTPDGAGIHKTQGGGGSTVGPSAIVIYSPAGGPPTYRYMLARVPAQKSLLEADHG